MWIYYVYVHYRASDGIPFYVGKSKLRKDEIVPTYERAHIVGRNKLWNNIYRKHGMTVEIIAHCRTDRDSQLLEIDLIKSIGRLDLKTGPLANLTDGGDGHSGIIASKDLRSKRSANARGPRSEAWVNSIRASRKNGGNGGVVKNGDKLPQHWCDSLSRSKVGKKNPFFGKSTPFSKKIINLKTGVVYDSINRAEIGENLPKGTLYRALLKYKKYGDIVHYAPRM